MYEAQLVELVHDLNYGSGDMQAVVTTLRHISGIAHMNCYAKFGVSKPSYVKIQQHDLEVMLANSSQAVCEV